MESASDADFMGYSHERLSEIQLFSDRLGVSITREGEVQRSGRSPCQMEIEVLCVPTSERGPLWPCRLREV